MQVGVAAAQGRLATERTDVGSAVRTGAVWGVIGAVVMAMYAMVAGATYLGTGFFTPMYHIASAVIEPDAMMASMQAAMERGNDFHFAAGPAMLGMAVHIAVGVAYGVVFGLLARALRLSGAGAVAAGLVFGLAVLAFSSFVGLPLAAAVFGGGDPIRDMPRIVGWPTFTLEHLLFGGVLGIGWMIRGARRRMPA
ncbi:MAG: hypothetical protein LC722_04900 [Actinobacteria bacterium]|nr:hypothetical protein [Actinomycetota bacterium]